MPKYVFKKKKLKLLIGAVDLLGGIICAPVRFLRAVKTKNMIPKNIVVLRLDQTGDCVQALPFFDALRKKYPAAGITAVVLESNSFLFKEKTGIDGVITIPVSWLAKGKKTGLKMVMGLVKSIKSGNFDLGFELRGDIRNTALLYFSGVKKIVGYACAGGGFMLDEEIPYDRDMHEIDKNLKLIGMGPASTPVTINFPESGWAAAAGFMEKASAGKKIKIMIHPFAGAASKMWVPGRYPELVRRILEVRKDALIFITGGPGDVQGWDQFKNSGVINAIGLPVEVSTAIVGKCDIFIGNDSFMQFVAAYSGLKTCVIAGYTSNYRRWSPKTEPEKLAVFHKPVKCGPCELNICNQKSHICMEMITVDEVFNSLIKWL